MINTSSKQEFMSRLFKHNLREKTLAVFCTLVIMLVAVCLQSVNKVYSLKVNVTVSPDQELVSENIGTIEVKVSGNFFELRKIKNEDLEINFDFSSEKAGEIVLNIGEKELPAAFAPIDVKSISPQMLVFRTEEKKTETAPEEPEETASETSSKEEKPAETSAEISPKEEKPVEISPEQKPVETFHETSPEKPAIEEKND